MRKILFAAFALLSLAGCEGDTFNDKRNLSISNGIKRIMATAEERHGCVPPETLALAKQLNKFLEEVKSKHAIIFWGSTICKP